MTRIHVSIETGEASPWQQVFSKDEVTIGRDENADVRLHPTEDTACSRGVHARLKRIDDSWELVVDHDAGIGIVDADDNQLKTLAGGDHIPVTERLFFELGFNGPKLCATPLDPAGLPVTAPPHKHGRRIPLPKGRVSPKLISGTRRVRNYVAGTALAVLLMAIVGTIVAIQLREEVAEIGPVINSVADDLEGFRRLSEDEWKVVRGEVTALDDQVQQDIGRKLHEYSSSVFLLGVKRPDGRFFLGGTGWSIEESRLATNAHVIDGLRRAPETWWTARRVTTAGIEDVQITRMTSHPGYDLASWVTDDIDAPAGSTVATIRETRTSFERPYDVGIVELAKPLGTPLPLATTAELDQLASGNEIGYLGYPASPGGTPDEFLPPIHQVGRVTRLTDYFYNPDRSGRDFLLHHSMPTRGGSSGSPIINRAGKVVAVNHGGTRHPVVYRVGLDPATSQEEQDSDSDVAERLRVETGGIELPFNRAQSVEFLRELLEGEKYAREAVKRRLAAWEDAKERYAILPQQLVNRRVDQVLSAGDWDDEAVVFHDEASLVLDDDVRLRHEVELIETGAYLIVAVAVDRSPLELRVTSEHHDEMDRSVLSSVGIDVHEPVTISITVWSPRPHTDSPQVYLRVSRLINQ